MKILHCVESYVPLVNGMQTVVQQLSERLVEMGHEVTVVTTKVSRRTYENYNGVIIKEFDISGNFTRGLSGEVDRYQEFLLNSNFDIVTAFAAQQWSADILLPILKIIKGKKVFVPTGFSGLFEPSYAMYFEQMKTWMQGFDANVFLSNNYRDINFARENNISNIYLIPNGADEKEFLSDAVVNIRKKYSIPRENKLILLVGGHTTQKGHKEAIEIFSKANIKNSTFFLIAHPVQGGGCESICKSDAEKYNNSSEAINNKKNIIVDFPSREETVAAYKESDLFFFPSNIECSPLVIFEAMAAKLPFLATDVGNISEIIEWSNGGQLLPTIKNESGYAKAEIADSIKLLEEFINNPEKVKELGENGYKEWESRFKWEKIAKDYENLYKDLLKKPGVPINLNMEIDILFEPNNLSDFDIFPDYFRELNIRKVYVLNTKNLQLEAILKNKKYKIISNKNDLTNTDKSSWILFLDSKNPIQIYQIKLMLEKVSIAEAGLIYVNFNSIAENRKLKSRFSIFEMEYEDWGYIFQTLLLRNKINSKLSNILLKTDAMRQVGGFDLSYNKLTDWDIILKISQKYRLEYINDYKPLTSIDNYDENDFTTDRFESELRIINNWITFADKKTLKIWTNYIGWKVKYILPDIKLLKLARKVLSKSSKNLLFKYTLGSVSLYILLTFIVGFTKNTIHITVNTFKQFILLLKYSILILIK